MGCEELTCETYVCGRKLKIAESAAGSGGIALNDNFREIQYRQPKCNYEGPGAPSASDSSSNDYCVGSRWLQTNAGPSGDGYKMWICVDDSAAAAVWAPWFRWEGSWTSTDLSIPARVVAILQFLSQSCYATSVVRPPIRRIFLNAAFHMPGGFAMAISAALCLAMVMSAPADEPQAEAADDEIALLIEALDHKDSAIRNRAVAALGERGLKAAKAVPKLIGMLATGDWRSDARDSLSLRDDKASPVLTLAQIGTPAVPALVEALSRKEKDVAEGAALALCRVRPVAPEALPTFSKMLESDDPVMRRLGAHCLGHLGESAATAVPMLIKALSDEDRGVRGTAIFAIGRIGQNASEAVPHLVEMLEKNPGNAESVTALGRMGATAAPAVPAIAVSLDSDDEAARIRAATALGAIGPAALDAVPDLVEKLNDPSLRVRLVVVQALGQIGPAAKVAVPALKKQLQLLSLIRQSELERRYIDKALQQIAGDDKKN